MSKFIEDRVRNWNDKDARETNRRLEYLEKKLFHTYDMSQPPNPEFWTRLKCWIENAKGVEDLEIDLFNSLNQIFYIGPLEFNELYRRAFNGPVSRWLLDKTSIDFSDINRAKALLNDEIKHTLFCPVSDSLKINHFYHINNISTSADIRPEWRTLQKLGDQTAISSYLNSANIRNIVLLEDFVGGGSQSKDALVFANKFSTSVSIFFVPLIICPTGVTLLNHLSTSYPFTFDPVLALPQNSFIQRHSHPSEGKELAKLRDLAKGTYLQVTDGQSPHATDASGKYLKPYHPLGWDQTGGLIIMHTNTPDNTLPMFHWESDTWNPLFPRHSRI